jgi:hypothetical protein
MSDASGRNILILGLIATYFVWHDPEKTPCRDPGMDSGFPERSCFTSMLERQAINPGQLAL